MEMNLPVLFLFLFTSYSAFAGSVISVSATPHNASNSCSTTNGSLTLTASGGNGNGQYLWTISGPNSYTASNFGSSPITFSGLAAGNYSVTVQDASVAGNTDSLDQNQPSFYNQEGDVNGISEWQSFIVGKTGLLTDLVMGFSTGPGANNIVSGTGTLSIYSGTGMTGTPLSTQTINISNNNTAASTVYFDSCHLTTPVYVSQRQVFTFSLTTTTLTGNLWLATGNPYPGACDLVYSGVGNGFGYQWVFKTYVIAPTIFSDGYAGTATATVGATTQCSPITATTTALNVTGCDSANGALTINITAGGDSTNSYYFNVSDGSQTASAYGPSGTTIGNLQAGTYSITVEDAATAGGNSAIDDSVPVGDITPHPVYNSPGSGYAWQSFYADKTGSLTQIDISFDNNYGDPGYYLTGTLSVYSGIGISGSLLTTQSGSVTVPGGNNYNHAYADFILSNPVNLTAGYEYTFEFTPTNRVDSTYYLDQTGSITGGECFENYITGYAMCFTTYVTASETDNSETVISQTISSTSLPATVSGNVSICAGDSAAISASGGTSYSWSPTVGLNCDTCSHPVAKPLATTTYYVAISNGSCSATDSIVVTANSANIPAISTADSLICSSDSATIIATGGYASYRWNDGDTTSYTTVNSGGGYWVTVTDANHCSAVSAHQGITVYPVPSVSIIRQGDTLSSYGEVNYQWLLNGTSLTGDTNSFVIARQAGSYTVQVTDTNGCAATSSAVIISGINGLAMDGSVSLYPNPSSAGSVQLVVGSELVGSALEIYDDNGQIVFQSEIRNPKTEINLNVAKGVYWLRIASANVNIVRKWVKI